MTKQASAHDLSRRGLIAAAGIGAVALPAIARAQAPAAPPGAPAPPTTITTPPRDFSPRGAPTTYFSDPDVLAVDPSFNALGRAVGGGAGVERRGPLSRVERHSQQPPAALAGG